MATVDDMAVASDASGAEDSAHQVDANAALDANGKEVALVESADPSASSSAHEVASEASADEGNMTKPSTPSLQDESPSPGKLMGLNGATARDVLAQLRAWKERSTRMELVLSKKNARVQELEETESKLKRLLAMAKRSIDNSKQEIVEKDAEIARLQEELSEVSAKREASVDPDEMTRDPRRILARVAHDGGFWCLIEYAHDEIEDEQESEYGWHRFSSVEAIKQYASRASGEPLVVPELSLSPYQVEESQREMKEEIDRVKEEFRRYRVRAEITRKQKDAEIRKMSQQSVARHTESLSETDVSAELQSARAQIRRLTKEHTESEQRELDWRRKYEKLMKDYEKLSGTMGETILAMEWRERYEHAAREKEELEKKMEEMKTQSDDLHSFRQDFARHQDYTSSSRTGSGREMLMGRPGGHFAAPSLSRMSSSSSLSGLETPSTTTQTEYLKNIVFKYMTSDQDEGKEHMETAIATVLNFSAAELRTVQEKRKQQGWFW